MQVLTKEQRKALKRVYDRCPILVSCGMTVPHCQPVRDERGVVVKFVRPQTYREFRRTVLPAFDGSGCVMVHWAGMWLGIERDGYTHS